MAIDRFNERQVACKIVTLNNNALSNPDAFFRNDDLTDMDTSSDSEPESDGARPKPRLPKLWREVKILKNICHPNITRIERVFYSEYRFYIIEDLITGGDLSSFIEQKKGIVEDDEACVIVYQILKAIQHLHHINVAHRDLKPENVLLSPSIPQIGHKYQQEHVPRVMLTDFGLAIKTGSSTSRLRRMHSKCGTVFYMAPEVQDKSKSMTSYTKAIDMWSLGCLTTTILLGNPLFAPTQETAQSAYDYSKLEDPRIWAHSSTNAQKFAKDLLKENAELRLTADDALFHAWFFGGNRKADIEEKYNRAIGGWIPAEPRADYVEDLGDWIRTRIRKHKNVHL
ncbi:MAG: hypothetical protein Q9167_002982 [Letrouitia subvulpina]